MPEESILEWEDESMVDVEARKQVKA